VFFSNQQVFIPDFDHRGGQHLLFFRPITYLVLRQQKTITMTHTTCKRMLTASLTSLLMITAGCHDQPSTNTADGANANTDAGGTKANANNPGTKIPDNPAKVVYHLTDAQKDVREFYQLCRDSLKGLIPIKAYTIRAEDLLAALGMDPKLVNSDQCIYHHVRVYLGFKKEQGFKLFMIPVEGADLSAPDSSAWQAGADILLDSTGKPGCRGSKVHLASADEYVLDLNAPCPTTCPSTSLIDR
jgi:hypothetical protein